MKRNLDQDTKKFPWMIASDDQTGAMKGIVVNVRDAFMSTMCQVWIYGQDGDLQDLDIDALPWAEFSYGGRNNITPPQLFDRVLVTFENGDKYTRKIVGYWYSTPMGHGTMAMDKRIGSELRPEVWPNRDLYPEANLIGASAEGNAIYFHDLFMNREYLASSVNLVDTGGKYFRIKSLLTDKKPYAPVDDLPIGEGSLYNKDFGETNAVRKGFESTEDIDPSAGSIELGHQRLKRSLVSGSDDFTHDLVAQKVSQEEVGYDSSCTAGTVFSKRLESSNMAMALSAMFLHAPEGVFISSAHMPPKRWDD